VPWDSASGLGRDGRGVLVSRRRLFLEAGRDVLLALLVRVV